MTTNPFQAFVQELIRQHGTAGTISEAIGMTLSAFSRGWRVEGTLGIEKLLRLAEWSGNPPSHVLRLGGKGDVAELIERLYGPEQQVSGRARDVATLWQSAKPEAQDVVFSLLSQAALRKPQHTKQRRRNG